MEKELLELRKELFETKDMNKALRVQVYNLRKENKSLSLIKDKESQKAISKEENMLKSRIYTCKDCGVAFEKNGILRNNLKYCDACSKIRYNENQRKQNEKKILESKKNINGKNKGKRQIIY